AAQERHVTLAVLRTAHGGRGHGLSAHRSGSLLEARRFPSFARDFAVCKRDGGHGNAPRGGHFLHKPFLGLVSGIADRGRDRGRGHAAARGRPGGKLRIPDADGYVARLQPEFFGYDLRDHGLDAAANVLHGREGFHRTILVDADFAARIHAVDAVPDGLGYADAALHRARIAGRLAPLLRPPKLLRSDAAFLPTRRAGIVLVHKLENVHAHFFGERVDRLLQAEHSLGMPRGSHRRSRAGVGEYVVLFREQVGAFVKILSRTGRA